MSSTIVDELVAILEYRIEGGANAKKFGAEMDRLERKAKKHGTTLARETKKASSAIERSEKRKREAMRKTDKQMSASAKFMKSNAAVLAGTAAGYAVYKGGTFAKDAFLEYAALERQLTRIGITAGATRDETSAALETIQGLSIDFGYDSVLEARLALDTLTAAGLDLKESLDFLPSILLTAQASGASTVDIANTAVKASKLLKIPAKDMQEAFDIMIAGGKAGQFELKDMAQYIPSLANGFAAIGGEGLEGLKELIALMQTVRQRTATSGEAATQFRNVLLKLNSEETIKKFSKAGVDLKAGFEEAEEKGESLITALIRMTNIATGGGLQKSSEKLNAELEEAARNGEDLAEAYERISKSVTSGDTSKFAQLFTDQEFRLGMLSIVTGTEDTKRFFEEVNNSEVTGGGLRDFAILAQDAQHEINRLSANWDKLGSSLGRDFSEVLNPIMDFINDDLDADRFAENQEELEKSTSGINEAADFQQRFGKFAEEEHTLFGGVRKREFTAKDRAANRLFEEGGAEALSKSAFNLPTKLRIKNLQLKAGNQEALNIDAGTLFGSIEKFEKAKKNLDSLRPEVATASLQNDMRSTINNTKNQGGVTNQSISIEQHVTKATDAPGAAAKTTADALSKMGSKRAQLQKGPSQP